MKTSAKFSVTKVDRSGNRKVSLMGTKQLQRFRAKRIKAIRKEELGSTQKGLAEAVGVNLRTLQDWELGRSPMPKPVEILLKLMRDVPIAKKRLLTELK